MTSPPQPATTYAARGRRQKAAVFAVATLLGLWLGTSAPAVSPVAPPPPAAAPGGRG